MKDLRLEGGEIRKPRQLPVGPIRTGKLSEKKEKRERRSVCEREGCLSLSLSPVEMPQ